MDTITGAFKGIGFDERRFFIESLKRDAAFLHGFFSHCFKDIKHLPNYIKRIEADIRKERGNYIPPTNRTSGGSYNPVIFTAFCLQRMNDSLFKQYGIKPLFSSDEAEKQALDSFYVTYITEGKKLIGNDPHFFRWFMMDISVAMIDMDKKTSVATFLKYLQYLYYAFLDAETGDNETISLRQMFPEMFQISPL